MWIDWLDLPKLTTLTTVDSGSKSFLNPRYITLESDSHPLWMMFRHPQSHQCDTNWECVRLSLSSSHQRKYSLHPSLTTRHWSSSRLPVINEMKHSLLFVPHTLPSMKPSTPHRTPPSRSSLPSLSPNKHPNHKAQQPDHPCTQTPHTPPRPRDRRR